ncbi:MAG: GyrI-like domain-containing protein [Actinobacteria bacterium]|nr:GyrI-like domain-containing protein [Actinomycetota bacterium]MBI3688523.1 GyrI-like domain-containing protein [Actinomycetota bacterium]
MSSTRTTSTTSTRAPATGTAPVKVDHRKALKPLYSATARPALVDVPPLQYLMVDGHGDPNTAPEYGEAVQALYAVAYSVKFAGRRGGGQDFAVMPLEGLWWVPDMSMFSVADRSAWNWTMMIMQSDGVTPQLVEQAHVAAASKAPAAALERLRLDRVNEGRAAQVLHVGPYATEGPTIERLHAFIAEQGLRLVGKHHEIYLGDPRRTVPERLRTVIRQPVASAEETWSAVRRQGDPLGVSGAARAVAGPTTRRRG